MYSNQLCHVKWGDEISASDSIFTLSPDLSRFKSTNNKSQLYHTDIHVQILIAFND